MTDWSAISAFLRAVVPWPVTQEDQGYVNLHWSFPDNKSASTPKANVLKGGRPTRTVETFIDDVAWRLARPEGYKDMFFCLSRQRDTKMSNGKARAAKSQAAALALKSIWVDVDVGPDEVDQAGKVVKAHYHTDKEALRAILLFAKTVGLPKPSAIVRSGGGLHVYWINRYSLTPNEWFPYADGLKQLLLANNVLADSSITTDAARILRVPGTFNHKPKYPRPMPVALMQMPLIMYDFPAKLAFLQKFAGRTNTAAPKPGFTPWADGVTSATFGKPHPAFAAFKDEPGLQAGIDTYGDTLLDPLPIFQRCGFYREALRNHGADHDQPQWNLAILGTTFMENGGEIAHKISSGHSTYTQADTQSMYDRKLAERSASGIGYPSCAAIAGAGCEACKTCPLLVKKSHRSTSDRPPRKTRRKSLRRVSNHRP